jgi:hypothetical protein
MLKVFLEQHQREILALTEAKTLELAGTHPSSAQMEQGLPTFYQQVMKVIAHAGEPTSPPPRDVDAIAEAADRGDEPAMAEAAGHPEEAELAKSAGEHGSEMLRLGYTLSHVVHAYGAMCQAITEVASKEDVTIPATEFHALNRCLDVAIAGAVTTFQALRDAESKEGRSVSHEMRSALTSANVALRSMQSGTVGCNGSTARALQQSLTRLGELVDQLEVAGEN